MDVQTTTSGELVERARGLRRGLRAALVELEDAVAAGGDADVWSDRVAAALKKVRRALDGHVDATEAPDGLLADVVMHEPRLAHHTDVLRREHVELYRGVDAELDHLPRVTARGEISSERERLLELIAQFSRHRHRGAQLVYDAYATDISVGD